MSCCCGNEKKPQSEIVDVAPSEQPTPEQKEVKEPPRQAPEQPPPEEEPKTIVEEPAPVVQEAPPKEPASKELDETSVELGFFDGKGNIKNFRFSQKPLGMNFNEEMPIRIGSFVPPSYAEACGVQIGMILATVEGESLERKTYQDAWAKLSAAVGKLPVQQG